MRLLIISDTMQQHLHPRPITALDRFTALEYKILRYMKRTPELVESMPAVIILSSKYGFILPDAAIVDYRASMNEESIDAMMKPLLRQYHSLVWPLIEEASQVHLHLRNNHRYALARTEFHIHTPSPKVTQSFQGVHIDQFCRFLGFEKGFESLQAPDGSMLYEYHETAVPIGLNVPV